MNGVKNTYSNNSRLLHTQLTAENSKSKKITRKLYNEP